MASLTTAISTYSLAILVIICNLELLLSVHYERTEAIAQSLPRLNQKERFWRLHNKSIRLMMWGVY